ncbi:hypothetical protein F10086_206 [Staphylococcus phage vB_SauM_JDF86]|nr:hypothetical protein F10086_206 [Staphylococcus phage vB_SauM_JDF86]
MKTVKILKNVEVTLDPIHNEIHVGQHFDKKYTNADHNITVTEIHKRIETNDHNRKYLVNAIEIK